MRPLWKGALTFGLVYVPVKVYPATEDREPHFRLLHRECHTPVEYHRYCPRCRRELTAEEVVRGYEFEKGSYVTVEDRDLAGLEPSQDRSITLVDFVPAGEVDPVYYRRSYYLAPADGGARVYELLRQTLARTGTVGLGRVVLRTRESPAAVRAGQRALILETLYHADEVRSQEAVAELNFRVALDERELEMAGRLVASLAAPFDPSRYTDARREALQELIRAKIAGREVVAPPAPPAAKVTDLMEALRRSIEMAEARGRERRRA
ncbi:MAG: Ku protein [Firmicutes bacterium]|nr:Ku protein [Bacillota bacterium]